MQAETIRDRILAVSPSAREPAVADAGPASDGYPVTVPKLNNNDAGYVLVQWLVTDGEAVDEGQPVALVETSKAVEEVVAGRAGVLRAALPPGADCAPGDAIAHLATGDATVAGAAVAGAAVAGAAGVPVGRPAAVGAPAATPTVAPAPAGAPLRLPAVQRRIAEAVTASHREIPAAFTVVRVGMDQALALVRGLTAETGAAVGLAELVVTVVARLHRSHPRIFAALTTSGEVVEADRPVIGVTVDAGTGLYLPVIRDAHELPIGDIADGLVDLRMKALRGRPREQDMRGMNFLVALNDAPGVVFAQPIVPPGVTCALSVPAVLDEVFVAADGSPRARSVADLGLAYDHRLVNGAQASAFLGDIGDALQCRDERADLSAS